MNSNFSFVQIFDPSYNEMDLCAPGSIVWNAPAKIILIKMAFSKTTGCHLICYFLLPYSIPEDVKVSIAFPTVC